MRAKAALALKNIFAIDLRALAVLRVSMALLILVDLAGRIPLFNIFYAGNSPYPLELARIACPLWVFPHLINNSALLQGSLFLLAAVFAMALLFGYYTRTACTLSWYLLVSIQFRNLNLLSVGDYVLVLLLFWSIFLPLGDRYSIDQARSKASKPQALLVYSTASAAILLQGAFVYFFASLAKMGGAVWVDGSAIEIILNAGVWVRPLGETLLQFPSILIGLTYLTLGIEFFCPLLLFIPIATKYFRYTALIILLCFHIGIASNIELHLIPFQMTLVLIPFLPSSFWNRSERLFCRADKNLQKPIPRHSTRHSNLTQRWVNILLAPILLYVILANIEKVHGNLHLVPYKIQKIAKAVLLEQGWFMYAPTPIAGDYRIYLRGKLSDGSDLHYALGADRRRWQKTKRSDSFEVFWSHYRARVYLYDELAFKSSADELEFFLRWAAQKWNEDHPNHQLRQLEIYKVIRWSPLLADAPDEKTVTLLTLILD